MKSIYFVIIGVISAGVIAISVIGIIEYQSLYNHNCNSDGGYVDGFFSCTYVHEDFAGPKIQGEIADEICAIAGGECPPYYIGNIQEDGSVMVGMTFSDGAQEKQFVFLINNGILSYKEYVNGKQISESIPEPERNPVPEGNYVDKNMYVYSVDEAESYLNYTLSTPYLPEGTILEKIKISSDKRKATLYYSNGLEVSHHPMGKNFNNTHYIENPARPEGKVFYDFGGTYAEGVQVTDPYYSVINIFRADRIYIKATMETELDELLRMIEPMNLNAPYVPYTPDPDYVMGAPEPEPTPEPEPEPAVPSGLQVDVTGQQQVRRGTTHDIVVDVSRDANPVPDALVRITIEDYGDNVFRDFKGRTDDSGRFVFSWEIPKSFDDIKTLLAYVDVTDDISAKTILFKFQVYCLPGETGCKVEGN